MFQNAKGRMGKIMTWGCHSGQPFVKQHIVSSLAVINKSCLISHSGSVPLIKKEKMSIVAYVEPEAKEMAFPYHLSHLIFTDHNVLPVICG